MQADKRISARAVLRCSALVALAAAAATAGAQTAPILQPGAPGQATRPLSADEASRIANTRFSPADVRYMQDMAVHHAQAVAMTALVKERTNRRSIVDAARRIDASQADEIAFIRGWLKQRGQSAPAVPAAMDHAAHGGQMPAHHMAMGMATPAQMAEMAAAKGASFDRLFLQRMIAHHEGAVKMSKALLDEAGTAADPILFEFVNDVINEQQSEIDRLSKLLVGIDEDPRSNLKAGFRDAGQAASNLRLVTSLPKPTGFFDKNNPAGLAPMKAEKKGEKPEPLDRSPLLSFANTDMAFSGNLLAAGNYHGFNLYRLDSGGIPQLVSSTICPGGQGDLSIVGNLLIMSVEQRRGRVDCGRQGVAGDVSAERFRGIRIFDISNPALPLQVGQVQTCRGSHTHSVVSGPGRDGRIIVYVSGTSTVRDEKELPGCVGEVPGDPRTALFRIDVVEIPVAAPQRARVVASPAVFADPRTGSLAGLWQGGDHGDGTQETHRTDQCHDITVFPARNLAAGACSGNGIIFDISNPLRPRRIDAVTDPGFAYWHSATFTNDGQRVLFTDEWGGGGRPRCRAQDPQNFGANAIYDIVEGKLRYRGHYKLPSAQTDQENCVAHNGSIVPVPGRDVFVQAWYQGGISVIDFTDPANAREIAYFDRGPVNGDHLAMGGFWSAYYYQGRIYGTEIARGLDVLALTPSAQLSANEIAAAALADQGPTFNPQQQLPVRWPAHPVVALAYVDQLERSAALAPPAVASLRQALGQATAALGARQRDAQLAGRLQALAGTVAVAANDQATVRRAAALRETMIAIAAQLR
ncbi:DUF305 domain-containing protein [Sphingomonas sinipercae]|uniref:DUF305 domain-containing protein n=1 Tax=Sphingomonas sinipercae TaxID=2714944 RepID=A0A6G7ZKE4_9SPHN|nr:DUF305 domain-containing protein [Sphingomonas sinipercae]QIL01380.1 DUF305 domain-containing protein [Sphingomonas sinipercae]